jgi:hypothetical protein
MEAAMAIVLDHTIVPAHDNEASAKFFAHIFGLNYEGAMSHFAPVRLNDTLVMDFDTCSLARKHADQPPRRRARVLLQGPERSPAGSPDSVVSPVVRSIGRAQFFVRGAGTSGRFIHPT